VQAQSGWLVSGVQGSCAFRMRLRVAIFACGMKVSTPEALETGQACLHIFGQ
jgi:hypothetical protein